MKKTILEHEWLPDHAEWPDGVPRSVGAELNGVKLVHIAHREDGIGLDIYWTAEKNFYEAEG